MYIVLNTVYLDKDLSIFITKAGALKHFASLPNQEHYLILDVNFKFVNDIKANLKRLFKIEKKVVLEPVLEPVQTQVQEPVVQPVVEPIVDEVKPTAEDKVE